MNATLSSNIITPDTIVSFGGYALFFISEALPFIRKKKQNNGIVHTIICILKGSQCMVGKILDTIEPPKAPEDTEAKDDAVVGDESKWEISVAKPENVDISF